MRQTIYRVDGSEVKDVKVRITGPLLWNIVLTGLVVLLAVLTFPLAAGFLVMPFGLFAFWAGVAVFWNLATLVSDKEMTFWQAWWLRARGWTNNIREFPYEVKDSLSYLDTCESNAREFPDIVTLRNLAATMRGLHQAHSLLRAKDVEYKGIETPSAYDTRAAIDNDKFNIRQKMIKVVNTSNMLADAEREAIARDKVAALESSMSNYDFDVTSVLDRADNETTIAEEYMRNR